MAIDWENLSTQPKTTTTTGSGIDWEDLGNRYAEQYNYQQAKKKVLDVSKLPAQNAYNQLSQARQAGIISKEEHLAKIKEINAREQAKIKSELQKSISPIEVAKSTAGTIGRGVKDFVFSSFETAGKQIPMGAEIGSGSVMTDPAYKTAMEKSINEAYKSGKISKSKADEYRNRLTAQVSTQQKKIETTEKKYGTRYDPSAGVMATFDVAGMAAGAPALVKSVTQAGMKAGAKVLTTETGQAVSQKVLASKPSQYLFGDKTAVQEAVAKAKAPKVVETPKVEPTVAEKPITPPKKIEVTTPQVTKTPQTDPLSYKTVDEYIKAQGEPVYHRSQNKFNKFDISKVSHDSNRQRYGWGLYFSDTIPHEQYGNYLYEARLPKGTFIDSQKPVDGKIVNKIVEAVKENNKNPSELIEFSHNGWLFYKTLSRILGGDKNASLFLSKNDIAGLKSNIGKNANDYILFNDNFIKTKQELTSLYHQAHSAPQVTKTPVGEQRVTGGAKKIEAETGTTIPEKATYTATSYKANKVSMDELAKNNKDEAFKVLDDMDNSTSTQRQEAYKALAKQAKDTNNVDDIMRLAKSKPLTERSEAAQTLGQSGYLADPKDPAKIISDVNKIKTKAASGRVKGKIADKVKKDTVSIKSNIKAPTKQDWASFIDELRCK